MSHSKLLERNSSAHGSLMHGVLIAGLAGAAALALLLSGCSSTDDDARKRLDDLENRVSAIEGHLDEKAEGVVDGADIDKTFSTADSYESYLRHLKDIEKRVTDAAAAADEVAVPDDAKKLPLAYQEAVTPLEDLQDELGHLREAFEVAGGSGGTVSAADLELLNATANDVDSSIDAAIDVVKKRFGV